MLFKNKWSRKQFSIKYRKESKVSFFFQRKKIMLYVKVQIPNFISVERLRFEMFIFYPC